jgi:acyl carrier protein
MTDTIRRLLAQNGKLHEAIDSIDDSTDLYDAGLTPFAAIRVMLALEEAFDVEFPAEMLRRQSFSSIDAIKACLQQATPITKLGRAA